MRKDRITITIDADLLERVDGLRERLGARSRSEVIDMAIRAGLTEGERVAGLLGSGFLQQIARALARGESPDVQQKLFDAIDQANKSNRR